MVNAAAAGEGRWRDWLYASVNVPFAMMQTPAFIILPSLYAQYAGLDLVLIGTILMALRLLDAVLDPAIGFLSDRTPGRYGRRKPWILAGAVVAGPAIVLAFQPSAQTGYVYFGVSFFFMTLGWTLSEIPHTAWLSELRGGYHERSRLATYRFNAGMAGTALVPLLALLPGLPGPAMTPAVTGLAGWLILVLMLATVPAALRWLPDPPLPLPLVPGVAAPPPGVRQVARGLWANRPLRLFAAMQAMTGLSSGMVSGLYYFYLNNYLGLSRSYSYVMLAVYLLSIVGGAVWLRIGKVVDKHRVNAICSVLVAATNLAMFLIVPGPHAFAVLLGVFAVAAVGVAGATAAQTALLADVIDYGALQQRRRNLVDAPASGNAGNYYAVFSFVNKAALAAGSGMSFIIAGLFGFSATQANGGMAMAGFFLAIIWIPLALNLLSAWCAWQFPLTRPHHAAIVRRLQRGAGRVPAQATSSTFTQ